MDNIKEAWHLLYISIKKWEKLPVYYLCLHLLQFKAVNYFPFNHNLWDNDVNCHCLLAFTPGLVASLDIFLLDTNIFQVCLLTSSKGEQSAEVLDLILSISVFYNTF